MIHTSARKFVVRKQSPVTFNPLFLFHLGFVEAGAHGHFRTMQTTHMFSRFFALLGLIGLPKAQLIKVDVSLLHSAEFGPSRACTTPVKLSGGCIRAIFPRVVLMKGACQSLRCRVALFHCSMPSYCFSQLLSSAFPSLLFQACSVTSRSAKM